MYSVIDADIAICEELKCSLRVFTPVDGFQLAMRNPNGTWRMTAMVRAFHGQSQEEEQSSQWYPRPTGGVSGDCPGFHRDGFLISSATRQSIFAEPENVTRRAESKGGNHKCNWLGLNTNRAKAPNNPQLQIHDLGFSNTSMELRSIFPAT